MILTPEIRQSMESVILAGATCANLCYMHAQRSMLSETEQHSCKEASDNWDKHLTALKVEMEKPR